MGFLRLAIALLFLSTITAWSEDPTLQFYNRGLQAYQNHDDAAAIRNFSQAIALVPGDAYPFHERGLAYMRAGQYDLAIRDFTEVILLKSWLASSALTHRGEIYELKGDLDSAIADYTDAVGVDRNNHEAFENRAIAYADRGEYSRAMAEIEK